MTQSHPVGKDSEISARLAHGLCPCRACAPTTPFSLSSLPTLPLSAAVFSFGGCVSAWTALSPGSLRLVRMKCGHPLGPLTTWVEWLGVCTSEAET